MNIESLTIAEIRQVAAIAASLGGSCKTNTPVSPFVGRYVLCRCYSAGVHCGELVSQDGDVVVLRNSRRLWQWKAKEGIALSGVAISGLAKTGSKVDVVVPEIMLTGVVETIPMTDVARETVNVS